MAESLTHIDVFRDQKFLKLTWTSSRPTERYFRSNVSDDPVKVTGKHFGRDELVYFDDDADCDVKLAPYLEQLEPLSFPP